MREQGHSLAEVSLYLYLTVTVHMYISEVPITNAMDSFSAEIGTHIPCTAKVGGLWCV